MCGATESPNYSLKADFAASLALATCLYSFFSDPRLAAGWYRLRNSAEIFSRVRGAQDRGHHFTCRLGRRLDHASAAQLLAIGSMAMNSKWSLAR